MTSPPLAPLTTEASAVSAIASAIRRAGAFALDLEFVSEGRYVPELALVQVAWGDPDAPELAAVDPLATDPRPLLDLVAAPEIEVIGHAAKQDLSLLMTRFDVRARSLWDTQIAAAFAGHGEQIGYGKLVARLFGVDLDKGPQYTDWAQRPLTPAQIRYAIEDVRHLPAMWRRLERELGDLGRLEWVREESERLAATAGVRPPPDEVYRHIGGWANLRPEAMGALRALAAWREREALATNTPPSWILPDAAMVELSKRPADNPRDLRRVRGVGPATIRRWGADLVAALERGMADPPVAPARDARQLPARQQAWAAMVASLIAARCAEHHLPARFVGGRAEAEELVAELERVAASGEEASGVALLSGWRREFAGELALSWLRGEIAIAADISAPGGIRTLPAR